MTTQSVAPAKPMGKTPAAELEDAKRQCALAGAALVIELRRDAESWRPGGEPWDVEDFVAVAAAAAHYGRIVLEAGQGGGQ